MPESNSPFPHLRTSGWLPFAATGLACIAIFVAWLFLSPGTMVAIIGFLVSILLGLVIATSLRKTPPSGQSSALETPFLLAHDTEVFDRYQSVGNSLLSISRQRDSIFRSVALEHLDELVRQATNIADGTFVFEGTEAWRIIYERLLRSPGLHLYRSVAWIKNANYWQDEPGRKSMAVNFEMHDAERLNIERIAIIADELWPVSEVWPVEPIRQWLHEQHARGIWIKFVRQSALAKEPELVADIGIYGSRAVGIQELDEQCRTVRFTLTFDATRVSDVEARWEKLAVYAESFATYIDRYDMPG